MDRPFSSFVLKRTWQASLLFFCSAAQLFDWVGAGFFCLPFPVHELSGYCCSPSAAAFGFSAVLLNPLKAPQRVILTNSLPPASALHWSFPRGKSAKTLWLLFTGAPCTSVCNPVAIGTGSAKALPSLGLLWAWDNPAFALEGPLFSEQRNDVRLVFRSC